MADDQQFEPSVIDAIDAQLRSLHDDLLRHSPAHRTAFRALPNCTARGTTTRYCGHGDCCAERAPDALWCCPCIASCSPVS